MVEYFDVRGGVDAMSDNRGIVYPNEAEVINTPKKILDLAYSVNRKRAILSICFPLSSLLVSLLPNFPNWVEGYWFGFALRTLRLACAGLFSVQFALPCTAK